ncbi:MAG: hypothetical protein BBJ57_09345 [Desulfobacterales bacterium PC51MH44]|nr:MAG: hypothetical protein BBJ57_09345 [Desulfobacterales bacterium PC51MH44]
MKGLPAIALAQARRAGDISKKFHRILQWSNMRGFLLGSPGSLYLAQLNTTYLATSFQADRYRLEKIGMTS